MYNVVGEGGLQYPAELETLKEWAKSGRLRADSFVIDTASSTRLRADKIPGLENVFADAKLRAMQPISIKPTYTPPRPPADTVAVAPLKTSTGTTSGSLFRIIGLFLLLGGGYWAFDAYANFDTSVQVPTQTIMGTTIGGQRVNNLGLMQEKQNRITMGGAIAIVGALLIVAGEIAQRGTKSTGEN